MNSGDYIADGIAPANDGPGNDAYRAMRDALAQVQAEERAR